MIEPSKSRRLRNKDNKHAVIRPHASIPEKVIIKDNLKVVTFLHPLSFQTQKRYKEVIRAFFNFYEGLKISDIESQHIENYLKAEFKNKSESTKAINKSALSSLFKFLVKDRYIISDPTFALKKVKVDKTKFFKPHTES